MKVLIVVDMQNDFVTGALANPEAQKIIPFIKQKIAEFRKDGACIVYTKDTHSDGYMETLEGKHLPIPHCISNTAGWEFVKELKPKKEDFVFYKSSFGFTGWQNYLENGIDVYLCGTCTDICVISNAIEIKNSCPRSEVYVYKDGCAGLTKEKHEHALDVMQSCQINVI